MINTSNSVASLGSSSQVIKTEWNMAHDPSHQGLHTTYKHHLHVLLFHSPVTGVQLYYLF